MCSGLLYHVMQSHIIIRVKQVLKINLLASRFKWPQSPFVYDILFARHLNFSTYFTKNFNISGTKQD